MQISNQTEIQAPASSLERGFALAGVSAMTAAAAAVAYFNPSTAGFFPACPLFKLTGLACPGCGLTRALHAFLHGDFLAALDFNLLLPVVLLMAGFLFVLLLLVAIRGRAPKTVFFSPRLVWGFFALALVFGFVRNLPFYPFSILYP